MYPIQKRYGEETWDIRQFVQPDTPGVVEIAGLLPQNEPQFIQAAWEWVVNNIAYPPGPFETEDRHYQEAFTGRARRRHLTYDYWSFPAETLALGMGDCEDSAMLLASILRTRLPESRVYVSVGTFNGYGHAWVTVDGMTLEATPPPEAPARYVALPEGPPYTAMLRFNDRHVIELQAGTAARRSRRKLALLRWYYAVVDTKYRNPILWC